MSCRSCLWHCLICSFNPHCLCKYFSFTTLSSFACYFILPLFFFQTNPNFNFILFLLLLPSSSSSLLIPLRVYVTWALWTWSVCLRPQRKCLWWWRSYMVTCWRWSSPVRKADCLRGSLSSSSHRCVCAPAKKGFVVCISYDTESAVVVVVCVSLITVNDVWLLQGLAAHFLRSAYLVTLMHI